MCGRRLEEEEEELLVILPYPGSSIGLGAPQGTEQRLGATDASTAYIISPHLTALGTCSCLWGGIRRAYARVPDRPLDNRMRHGKMADTFGHCQGSGRVLCRMSTSQRCWKPLRSASVSRLARPHHKGPCARVPAEQSCAGYSIGNVSDYISCWDCERSGPSRLTAAEACTAVACNEAAPIIHQACIGRY